jgi:hypothetical protein
MNRPDEGRFRIVRSASAAAALAPSDHSGRGLPLDSPNPKTARHWLVCHESWRAVVIAEPPGIRSPIHRLLVSAGGRLVAIGPTRTVYAVPVAHPTAQPASPAVPDRRRSARPPIFAFPLPRVARTGSGKPHPCQRPGHRAMTADPTTMNTDPADPSLDNTCRHLGRSVSRD